MSTIEDRFNIEVMYGLRNEGWGGAVNKVLDTKRWCHGDILAVSAHDAILTKYDRQIVEKEFSDVSTVFLSPNYPRPERCYYSVARGFRCHFQKASNRSEVAVGHATLCFFRAQVINKLRYDENFFIYGCESEIFLRAHDLGYKTIMTDQIIVSNPSTDSGSEFRELAFSINSLYLSRLRGGRVGYTIRLGVMFISLFRARNIRQRVIVFAKIRGILFSLRSGGAGFREYLRQHDYTS